MRRLLCFIFGHAWCVPIISVGGSEYAICERCDAITPEEGAR